MSGMNEAKSTPGNVAGYEPELFVDKIDDDFLCNICHGVVRAPMDLPCAHLYCGDCINKWQFLGNNSCPRCRADIDLMLCKENIFVKKKIWRMRVKCSNHKAGCNATFVMGDEEKNVYKHQAECQFELVRCYDCGDKMLRCDLQLHKADSCVHRLVECNICHEKLKAVMLAEHQNSPLGCQAMMYCPNRCTRTPNTDDLAALDAYNGDTKASEPANSKSDLTIVKIQDLPQHEAVCPLQRIKCTFCSKTIYRKDFDAHIASSTADHMMVLLKRVQEVEEANERLVAENQKLKQDLEFVGDMCQASHPITFEYTVRNISSLEGDSYSPSYLRGNHKFRLNAKKNKDSNSIGLYLWYDEGPLPYQIEYHLMVKKRRSDGIAKKESILSIDHVFREHESWGFHEFATLKDLEARGGYDYEDDAITFGVLIGPQCWVMSQHASDPKEYKSSVHHSQSSSHG